MTRQSPRRVRIFVSGLNGSPGDDLGACLERLRRSGDKLPVDVAGLRFEASDVPGARSIAELRGFAQTPQRPREQDPGDLDPARTIRRALADGRMNAADLRYGCAWAEGEASAGRAMAALQTGLGRFASAMVLESSPDALGIAAEWAARGGSVALLIKPGVGSIALAFGRP